MAFFPVFLSVVYVVRNRSDQLESILTTTSLLLSSAVSDYEIIVVDNASNDDSIATIKNISGENGLSNLQIYALTKEIDVNTASWVGLENALGDFVAVLDPFADDIAFLPKMLEKSARGADVVFTHNQQQQQHSFFYGISSSIFIYLYRLFSGIHLAQDAPPYRLLSKRVVNFMLQHPQPVVIYRHLPATGGFARVNMTYSAKPSAVDKKTFWNSLDRGLRLLVSTTHAPMRIVTSLSLFGAVANLVYSVYVLGAAFFKSNIASGWVSLSLQQSGMFFLISLVLLVLGEYILQMATLSNEGPLYHVGQEFTSARITRHAKLNVEEVHSLPSASHDASLTNV